MKIQPDPIEAAFNQAVDQPSSEARESFLREFCGEDSPLLERLRELLAAYSGADRFLENPPASEQTVVQKDSELNAMFASLKPEGGGDRIGHYKLLQQIGEGGFGVVWMAEQEKPIRRRVALKIIKIGMDTKEVVARFEQERQALAMMEHPNIAKVFDAGATQHGRPFFVMELVRGIKITDYCDEAKLSTIERLNLFIAVCQAVQHAHQKGIIHRDLKPSNILVTLHDGVPVPKVIDFGVAKATQQQRLTDLTLFTQFEQMIGTPLYMSPEQAEMSGLDVDTRSDIYSLGVLLYELLAGRTPFDPEQLMKVGYDEMRRVIREEEPQKPSTFLGTMAVERRTAVAHHRQSESAKLINSIHGDLDWIVMKALEKDRSRRYETANELARDIERHLTDEPVLARPPTRLYRFRRMVRRNKVAFAAAAAVAMALVMGLAVSLWQAVRAVAAEKRTGAALADLKASTPAFADQARALAAREQFSEAIEKLDYALKLRPDSTEYLLAKANLLQSQLRLAEADGAYREVLARAPSDDRAKANAALCEKLLLASPDPQNLSREDLSALFATMRSEHRPPAEMMRVGRLLHEEGGLLLPYWLDRLKGLPIPPGTPLEKRLTRRDDGLLALDLSATPMVDLRALKGMPLGSLNCNACATLESLDPLRGMPLKELSIEGTRVSDLSPLETLTALERLRATGTGVSDVAALRGLPLRELAIGDTKIRDLAPLRGLPLEVLSIDHLPVTDLSPQAGMKLKEFFASGVPVTDFTPLSGLPLEVLSLKNAASLRDLSFLRGLPLRKLVLSGCSEATNFAVLSSIPSLELLLLPEQLFKFSPLELKAIGDLRAHPGIRQLDLKNLEERLSFGPSIRSKEEFWAIWDRVGQYFDPLRKAGVKFTDLSILADGTWRVYLEEGTAGNIECLKGAPISELVLVTMPVSDLSPLEGMPLTSLGLQRVPANDLRPLKGLPLTSLFMFDGTSGVDVGVLAGIPTLERLLLPPEARNFEGLRKLPNLKYISFEWAKNAQRPVLTAEQFWKTQEAIASFVEPLRKAGHKVIVVSMADGTLDLSIENQPVRDIASLRGAPISRLVLSGTKVIDLRPLIGMPLKVLGIHGTKVTDLRPLQGLPLTHLSLPGGPPGIDVGVLAGILTLEDLLLPAEPRNLDTLRSLPNLKFIAYDWDFKASRPTLTAEQFWKQPVHCDDLVRQGKFADAGQLVRQRLKAGTPDERGDWLRLAALEVLDGNQKGYRATCADVVKRYEKTTVPREAEITAKVCLLLSDSGVTATDIAALLDKARPMEKDADLEPWFSLVRGIHEYRCGHWDASAAALNGMGPIAVRADEPPIRASKSALLAMIDHQQKNPTGARAKLQRARDEIPGEWRDRTGQWGDWLVVILLVREAGKLIGDETPVGSN